MCKVIAICNQKGGVQDHHNSKSWSWNGKGRKKGVCN